MMPLVPENVYSNQANAYDYFCAPVSGQGYINAGNFEAENDSQVAGIVRRNDELTVLREEGHIVILRVGIAKDGTVIVQKAMESLLKGVAHDGHLIIVNVEILVADTIVLDELVGKAGRLVVLVDQALGGQLPAEQDKHYVAFVVSDGDNATYWQNTAAFAANYMNASVDW